MAPAANSSADDPGDQRGRLSILAGSTVIAVAACIAINNLFLAPEGLQVRTTVVGHPTHADFDSPHYIELFVLAVGAFPILLGVSYLVLSRVVPSLLRRRDVHRVAVDAGVVTRLAVPGAVVGLGGAVASDATPGGVALWLVGGIVAYSLLVIVVATLLRRRRAAGSADAATRLAAANAVCVPLTVLAVAAASSASTVTVASTGDVEHHPFLPWPIALVVVAVLVAVVGRKVRAEWAGGADPIRRVEKDTVALVSGSVLVFLVTARLPGARGTLDAFHEGEGLATATLLRDGAFPWRDILFIHGPLFDGLMALGSFAVFGTSRWGAAAGAGVLIVPLCWVLLWMLLVRVLGSNWVLLAAVPIALAAGADYLDGAVLYASAPRLACLPVVVLALLWTMRSDRWIAPLVLGASAATAFLLTPELAFGVVAVGAAVLGRDIVEARPPRWRDALVTYRRSLLCAVGFAGVAAVFMGWLALNGAVDDFVYYFRTFAPDHELTGAFTIDLATRPPDYIFAAVLPLVLAVVTGAYFAWRLATRRPIGPLDWTMGSLAVLGLLFYPKFLARADAHVYAGVAIGFPLLVYVIARILEPGDRLLSRVGRRGGPAHLVSVAVVGAVLASAVLPATRGLGEVPERFRASAEDEADGRLGYGTDDALAAPNVVQDLSVALGALGPDVRLFDFTNQPAIVHFLLGLPATTRYPHVSMAIREPNQADLIGELADDPPEVVLYWSDTYGLTIWDGISNPVRHYDVSQWLLEHYTPWVSVSGEYLWVRNDLDPPDPETFADQLSAPPLVGAVPSRMPNCDWGTAPAFLDDDRQVDTGGPRLAGQLTDRHVSATGWVAPVEGETPQRVIAATGDGTVVSEALVDVPPAGRTAEEDEEAAVGFAIEVPLLPVESADDIRLFAVTQGGAVAPVGGTAPGAGSVSDVDGRPPTTVSETAVGAVDTWSVGAYRPDERVERLTVPPGAFREHDWLELEGDGRLAQASFVLTDTPGRQVPDSTGAPTPSGIRFTTTGREGDRYLVQGASCPQWRGLDGRSVYLRNDGPEDVSVTLQRSLERPGW
jgi:hypothetical protein